MYKQEKDKVIVYNLDFSEENWDIIQKLFPSCIFRVFDYSKYPSYYNINVNAGEYAWKPALIKECLEFIPKGEIICWMDSGNIITENLSNLEYIIKNSSIYSPISISGYIKSWTHKGTLDYMKPPKEFLDLKNRNGACIAFDTSKVWIIEFINEWAHLSSIKKCIAPEGSSRENHRQDQSILSILYYYYHQKYNFNIYDDYITYDIHKDIDETPSVNLAIVCLESNNLHVDKILKIIDICGYKSYDLFYYNAVLNNKKYTTHFSQFLEPILKKYERIVLTTDNDEFTGQVQSVRFFKNSDSVGGDIGQVYPWPISNLFVELYKNNEAKGINTLGYLKNIINSIQKNIYLEHGGIYLKTNDISNLYFTLGAIQWSPQKVHFNIIM